MRKPVKKAVIPAAGLGTRFLPATKAQPKEMLPIVDKPTIQYIIEEAVASGIEEILIVTSSTKRPIEDHFDKSYELEDTLAKKGKDDMLKMVRDISDLAQIHYVRQKEAKGLGHAILCAKTFIKDEPFVVLLGDDVVVNESNPATKQLVEAYNKIGCSIMGVQSVEKEEVSKYGIVKPSSSSKPDGRMVKLSGMVEKPKTEEAPSTLAVMGRYVLTPEIFEMLETQEPGAGDEIQLTDAIHRLMDRQAVYAYDFEGNRYDVGDKFGFIKATIDFALDREDLRKQVSDYLLNEVTPRLQTKAAVEEVMEEATVDAE
ncbi:MAG TPA: UTP--glucose-1-phosphate uridylyltransferase [Firmicutes bacterium]|nr:UTP--glucose-1-phosphate uridylyltransferase [Bacillota bacterium]